MSNALPSADSCVNQCTSPVVVDIPGTQGLSAYQVAVNNGFVGTEAQWLASLDGTDGVDAFTTLSSGFTMPAELANVTVSVAVSSWMVIGQLIFVQGAGWFQVILLPTSTSATIKNLKDTGSSAYMTNVAPGTAVGSGGKVSPGGMQGIQGIAGGGGDMLRANNLSDVVSPDTSLSNLGATVVGKQFIRMTSPSALRFLNISAGNTVQQRTQAQMISDLALVIGTNTEAWSAILDALASVTGAADKLPYFTGATAMSVTNLTSVARSLLAQSTVADELVQLGRVKPRYGILGSLTAVDANVANSDNALQISATRYIIRRIVFENASTSLTTARAGVFTAAGGGGTTIAADAALSALTASSKWVDFGLAGVAGTDVFTAGTIYVRISTAQGAPATFNAWVEGEDLS